MLTALIYGAIFFAAPDSIGKHTLTLAEKYKPRLGLDLEGGTSVILTPRRHQGLRARSPRTRSNQAVTIIRNRVDSFGVAESEVTTAGNNIVISIPGKQDKNILATVQQTAELRFRQVLVSGAGSATPVPTAVAVTDAPPAAATAQHVHEQHRRRRRRPRARTTPSVPKALRKAVSAATTPSPTPTGSASAPRRPPPRPLRPTTTSADGDHARAAAEVRRAGLRRTSSRSARQLRNRAPTTRRSRW